MQRVAQTLEVWRSKYSGTKSSWQQLEYKMGEERMEWEEVKMGRWRNLQEVDHEKLTFHAKQNDLTLKVIT